jgi:hypothetical protein
MAILDPALASFSELGDVPEVNGLVAALARTALFADDYGRAVELADRALATAERTDEVAQFTEALLTKGTTLGYAGRDREALILLDGGLHLAEANGFVTSEFRARLNMSSLQLSDDPRLSQQTALAGLDRARRLGYRDWTVLLAGNAANGGFALGDWDRQQETAHDVLSTGKVDSNAQELLGTVLVIELVRGPAADWQRRWDEYVALASGATGTQEQTTSALYDAWVNLVMGRYRAVLERRVAEMDPTNGLLWQLVVAHGAAWSRDLEMARRTERTMQELDRGRGRWAAACRGSVRAAIAALEGRGADASAGWRKSLAIMRELGCRLDLALIAMDIVAASADTGEAADAETEARRALTELGASALLKRLDELAASRTPADAVIAAPPAASSRLPEVSRVD